MKNLYPHAMADRVYRITPQLLHEWGIKGLILDIDNTLTTHDNPIPDEGVARWLDDNRREGIKMIVLSNNKPERVEPFAKILGLEFIANGAKPLKKGYKRCSKALGIPCENLCMVGDQIFTDILGGRNAGCKTVLVEPIQKEKMLFFKFKRMLERLTMNLCPKEIEKEILHLDKEGKMMGAKFGPAGNSDSFKTMGYKKTRQVPEYIVRMGLDAYEYQCGRGVRITEEAAKELGAKAKELNVALSLHSPYYISLSSVEEEKRQNSIEYILQSAKAASAMGAKRVVVHSGSCSKISREAALELAKDTMARAYKVLDEQGLGHIHLCPETMGKTNQLGTLEEVLELCRIDERLIPCVDFGHLNARTFGGMNSSEAFAKALELMEDKLGLDRMRVFHSHFSKIEYTEPGGEKRHLTFEDKTYGPDFEPLGELIAKKMCEPTFICESAGTQAEDAAYMKKVYIAGT